MTSCKLWCVVCLLKRGRKLEISSNQPDGRTILLHALRILARREVFDRHFIAPHFSTLGTIQVIAAVIC